MSIALHNIALCYIILIPNVREIFFVVAPAALLSVRCALCAFAAAAACERTDLSLRSYYVCCVESIFYQINYETRIIWCFCRVLCVCCVVCCALCSPPLLLRKWKRQSGPRATGVGDCWLAFSAAVTMHHPSYLWSTSPRAIHLLAGTITTTAMVYRTSTENTRKHTDKQKEKQGQEYTTTKPHGKCSFFSPLSLSPFSVFGSLYQRFILSVAKHTHTIFVVMHYAMYFSGASLYWLICLLSCCPPLLLLLVYPLLDSARTLLWQAALPPRPPSALNLFPCFLTVRLCWPLCSLLFLHWLSWFSTSTHFSSGLFPLNAFCCRRSDNRLHFTIALLWSIAWLFLCRSRSLSLSRSLFLPINTASNIRLQWSSLRRRLV